MSSSRRTNPRLYGECIIVGSLLLVGNTVNGFSSSSIITSVSTRRALVLPMTNTYGRGAEIWPECNEDPVQLADSFPNGQVPIGALMAMGQQDMAAVHETVEETVTHKRRSKRKMVSNSIRRILRRAAAKEELDSEAAAEANPLDRTPMIIAIGLVVRGLVRPMDIVLAAFFTFYFIVLNMVARSPRETSGAPVLPAMPPQGHVPTMVSNPLGMGIMYSKTYDLWLKLGVVVGLAGPLLLLTNYMVHKEIQAAQVCARPIFLLCCQAMSEAFSRRVMAPLPLRILVPVMYNIARLGYLWDWALNPASLGAVGRGLAIANAVYWASNLFAFLIPVATIRYMRAHFFGVEAAEVTTRIGMEESAGLIPNQ